MSQAKRCGSCDAYVLWAVIRRRDGGGSRMPLNLKPDMAGNIATTKDVHGHLTGRVLVGDEGCEIGETRYQTHFATCVNSDQHRRRNQPPSEQPDPVNLLKIARRDLAQVVRIAADHHANCKNRGCAECQRLGAHIHRCERQLALLTPQVEAPQESLF